MSILDSLLLDASSFVVSEFGFDIENSKLKPYSPEQWQEFCHRNGFVADSDGLYVPASYSAYVRTDCPALICSIFHELYGHGLFVEHSAIGKKLVDIIQVKGDEKSFMFDEVDPRKQFFGLCKRNVCNYEGFAVWLEALLCEKTDTTAVWMSKKERMSRQYISLFEYFKEAEQRLSRFGFLSQLGFPKFYTDEYIVDVIKRVYSSAFENIECIVLYGSQKPESDIDLFVISKNQSTNYFNGWLDIYELNEQEFAQLSDNLDISVTDPLFTGRLIYGDKTAFEQIKQKLSSHVITRESICHNYAEAEKQKKYLTSFSETDKRRRDCLSYIVSFSQNAEQLALGNKPFTLTNLKKIYARETS